MLTFPMSGGQWIAERTDTQGQLVRCRSTALTDMMKPALISPGCTGHESPAHTPQPQAPPGIKPHFFFPRRPAGPGVQEPKGPASLGRAVWQEKPSNGLESGCCCTSPSCSLWILLPLPPHFLPDLELRHQHLLWLNNRSRWPQGLWLPTSSWPSPHPVTARGDHAWS